MAVSSRSARATAFKLVRNFLYQLIPSSLPTPVQGGDPNVAKLANSFSRYASTSPTAFDSGAAQSSSAVGVSILQRQAERAISQVLGRAPGRAADSFMAALNDAFPAGADGQVAFTPARSVATMVSPNGYGTTSGASQDAAMTRQSVAAGLIGQLSVEQAALYREASTVAADALSVLAGLQAFAPVADPRAVDMLRAVVQSEIKSLVEEFGRIDLPRTDRVDSYFTLLLGANQDAGHLGDLGKRALLDGSWDPTAESEEAQIAGFNLLQKYALALYDMWRRYRPNPKGVLAFSLQIQEASRMLSVVAESNNDFMAAMDSIGFDENQRRAFGLTFDTLVLPPVKVPLTLQLPSITVYDLTAWFDSLTNVDGQSTLSDAGLYGLDFVTDQANQLFILLATILIAVRLGPQAGPGGGALLQQVLTHERVGWALDNLFFQAKTLADLAA